MANRWKGNIISAAATTSDGTNYTGKANGAWSLNSQMQQKQANLWAVGLSKPDAPTGLVAVSSGATQANVNFSAPVLTGGLPITYTVTSSPDSISASGSSSPITVAGLTTGNTYTFTAIASNSLGNSPSSSPSNSVVIGNTAILIGVSTSPYINAYDLDTTANTFGTKQSNPGTLPTAAISSIAFSPNGKSVALGNAGFANPLVYAWSGSIGTKYSDPSITVGTAINDIVFSNDSSKIIMATSTPFVAAYNWSAVSGFGTRLSGPSSTPSGSIKICRNSDTTLVLTGHFASPYSTAISVGTSLGGLTSGNSSFGSAVNQAVFSKNSDAVIGATDSSPGIAASHGVGGTMYSNPVSPPNASGQSLAQSYNGSTIFVGHSTSSPYLQAYPFSSSGFGTKYASLSNAPTATEYSIATHEISDLMAYSVNYSPYCYVRHFSGGYGTVFSSPSTAITGTAQSIAFTPY